MEFEINDLDDGKEIKVFTEEEVAVVVDTGSSERIYLPATGAEDTSYYADEPDALTRFQDGYRVVHHGYVKNLEIVH